MAIPIAGETIAFTLPQNLNNTIGATLSAPSAVTNINGQATVTYTAGKSDTVTTDGVRAVCVRDTSLSRTTTISVDATAQSSGGSM